MELRSALRSPRAPNDASPGAVGGGPPPKRAWSAGRLDAANRSREWATGPPRVAGADRAAAPSSARPAARCGARKRRQTMQGFDPEVDALQGDAGEVCGAVPGERGERGEACESGEGFEAGEGEGYETSESQRVFDEVEEMELAGALLEVASEGELDRFLGDLVRRASRAVGSVVRSP